MVLGRKVLIGLFALMMVGTLLAGAAPKAEAQSVSLYNTRGQSIDSRNRFPLDRFSRGEWCLIVVNGVRGGGTYSIVSDRGTERRAVRIGECFAEWFMVPTNVFADNVTVKVSGRSPVSKRIPIGAK